MPAVVDAAHAALGGVGSDWPALLGYNRTVAKAGSTVPATIGDDPLVALGTAGAGRTGVFTSDMSPHWAPPQFMEWAGYAPLWQGLAGWLTRK